MTSGYAEIGSIDFPLDPSAVTTTLATVADPARSALLSLFKAVLIAECQAAFNVAKAGTKLDGYVVDMCIPFNPESFIIKAVKLDYPLLALWRTKSVFQEKTLAKGARVTDWTLNYILGEMTNLEMGRLYTILTAAEALIMSVCETGYHPAYNDGYAFLESMGLVELGVTESVYGHWEATGGDSEIMVPTLQMTLRTVEEVFDNVPAVSFEGMTARVHLARDGYDSIQDFADGYSEHVPTPSLAI